jgi:hypothetical protein
MFAVGGGPALGLARVTHLRRYAPERSSSTVKARALGGAALVTMMQAADFGHRDDSATVGGLDRARIGGVLPKRQVRARPLIVGEVRVEQASEVPFAQNDHVVEALAANRPDDALDVRILPGGSWGSADAGHPERVDGVAEGGVEDRVPVVQQVARRDAPRKRLAELLPRPRRRGMRRDVDVEDATAVVGEHHEDKQQATGDRRHSEEIDGHKRPDVVLKEGPPRLGGWAATARQEPRDGALGDVEAKREQFTVDARCTPEGVGCGHLVN